MAATPTAQGVLPSSDIPRFENADKAIAKPEIQKIEVADPVSTPSQKADTVEIGEHDLRQNPELTAKLIERALHSQNWALLADLLPLYRSLPQYDEILYDYANGALLRSQKKHREAIAAYRRIIAEDPSLSYVRLDLAGMLYENKQYQASKDQFERVKADDITEEARMMADIYLLRIQKQQGWVVNAGVQYERNDNVNNASSIRYIDTSLGRLERNEDSLPKKANGLKYDFSAERDWNIKGNHYLTTEVVFDGVQYWDNNDYSEQSIHLGAGYKNQNIQQWTSVTPFVGYHRLGGEAYSRNFGVNTQHGRWLNDNWQVVGAFTHLQRRYAQSYLSERYDGHLNNLSVTAAWLPQAGLMIYGGADYGRERAAESQESSKRKGLRTGVLKEWSNGLSTRVNLRYAHRNFDAPNQFFGTVRRDKEYQANFAIWHRSIHLYGITPKLNFQYLKVKSNIPAFYSRQNKQWFITLEKTF
ncbi:surface lipoprotein assembly modifier [Neisseria montereyensis]|uniref:Surface lipoprotein assembly modifier n=1 Tax=Neisseria montereyensis TaxID=2973938 RepID=A0ABT2FE18_9NEIS|nr:surface lipoprotein assembly modifier [Neisseria montereyensis]MCS4533984.1 surface lipoprotein assembly modifier [Neisseria montereyensis]